MTEDLAEAVLILSAPFRVEVATQYFWGRQRITYYEGAVSRVRLKYEHVTTDNGEAS